MFLHIRFLVKAFSAVLAGIGPGVRVDEQVRGQRAGPFEALSTLLTLHNVLKPSNILMNY